MQGSPLWTAGFDCRHAEGNPFPEGSRLETAPTKYTNLFLPQMHTDKRR